MGAILNATPDMGDWQVEVRSESAYLIYASQAYTDWNLGDAPPPDGTTGLHALGDGGVGFPVGELDRVYAAVAQITGHTAYHARPILTATPGPTWRVDLVEGVVQVRGPVLIYGGGAPARPVYVVELEYTDLAVLADLLEETQTAIAGHGR